MNINGTNNTASTVISESNYSGTFSQQSSTCASGGNAQSGQTPNGAIATINPTSGIANGGMITVTGSEAGMCTIVFADASNQTVTLTINVTTTVLTVNRRPPGPIAPRPRASTSPSRPGRL